MLSYYLMYMYIRSLCLPCWLISLANIDNMMGWFQWDGCFVLIWENGSFWWVTLFLEFYNLVFITRNVAWSWWDLLQQVQSSSCLLQLIIRSCSVCIFYLPTIYWLSYYGSILIYSICISFEFEFTFNYFLHWLLNIIQWLILFLL